MNKSLKTLAAAMLLGSTAMAPFAIAQDAAPGATTTPPAATDGTTGSGATGTGVAPVTPDANSGAAGTMGTTAQDTTGAASGNATYLTEQAENHISVNDFMGQAIYTADNQSIGNINDLLVEKDGGVVAAVVGVGGFLGIGEKNVAVPFENITITRVMDDDTAMTGTDGTATTDGTAATGMGTTGTTGTAGTTAATGTDQTQVEQVADAEVRLTTTETAESLRNAPEFRTLDDQADDATDGTTTSSTDNN
ncbi:PRC-barrel domain-containing protein [Rhizobium sp. AQ_MP]|uniref:PRC-barrel domain-containing protein n=1 Tax=Rhizobium sp. AQ_MP TaxID=2761536 RepID=UPI0013A57E86|nr:PRC-barrel domain-containing protein [Rhizobium sp. AQ_MP]MBC2773048.1 PRC-barrel domain-containing protein [Rhizobium sp. AQ_MP]